MNPYRTLRSVVRFRPFETDRLERRLAKAASVADLRAMARRRLPRGVFDYIDGGAEDERTLAENSAAFRRIGFRPRVLAGSRRSTWARPCSGGRSPFPLVLAPTGFTRIADPDGELAVARAAARAGLPYTLSHAGHPLDRGGRRGQRGAQVVPALHVPRPRPGRGDGRAGPRRRLRGAGVHRRHRRARPAGARRAPRLRAAAQDRPRHAARRRHPPGLDVGVRPQRADPLRQRRRPATWATARTAVSLADYIPSRWTPASPGPTRSGCARSGTAPS